MSTYPDQHHRCQAVSRTGRQCRNAGQGNNIHPARLCAAHQQAALDGSLQLTVEGQAEVDRWRQVEHERQRLTARFYYAGCDQVLWDGSYIANFPISPFYATPEQAHEAAERLRDAYPEGKVICSESYCDTEEERDRILKVVIQPEEETA